MHSRKNAKQVGQGSVEEREELNVPQHEKLARAEKYERNNAQVDNNHYKQIKSLKKKLQRQSQKNRQEQQRISKKYSKLLKEADPESADKLEGFSVPEIRNPLSDMLREEKADQVKDLLTEKLLSQYRATKDSLFDTRIEAISQVFGGLVILGNSRDMKQFSIAMGGLFLTHFKKIHLNALSNVADDFATKFMNYKSEYLYKPNSSCSSPSDSSNDIVSNGGYDSDGERLEGKMTDQIHNIVLSVRGMTKSVGELPLFNAFKNFLLIIFSTGFFKEELAAQDGFLTQLIKYFDMNTDLTYFGGLKLCDAILNVVEFCCEASYAMESGTPLMQFILPETLHARYAKIASKRLLFSQGRLQEVYSNVDQYHAELRALNNELVRAVGNTKLQPSYKATYSTYLAQVCQCLVEVDAYKEKAGVKQQAFGIIIYGEPGCGKNGLQSDVLTAISQATGKKEFLDTRKHYYHTRSDEYASGYREDHLVYKMDDIAQKRCPTNDPTKEDAAVISELINNAPTMTVQADIQNKGKIMYNFELFIGDTNVEDIHMNRVSNAPMALVRRLNFVHVEVLPQYRMPGTFSLDSSRIPAGKKVETHRARCYTWQYRDEQAKNLTLVYGEWMPFSQYVTYIAKYARAHFRSQESYVTMMRKKLVTPVCTSCYLDFDLCRCKDSDIEEDENVIYEPIKARLGVLEPVVDKRRQQMLIKQDKEVSKEFTPLIKGAKKMLGFEDKLENMFSSQEIWQFCVVWGDTYIAQLAQVNPFNFGTYVNKWFLNFNLAVIWLWLQIVRRFLGRAAGPTFWILSTLFLTRLNPYLFFVWLIGAVFYCTYLMKLTSEACRDVIQSEILKRTSQHLGPVSVAGVFVGFAAILKVVAKLNPEPTLQNVDSGGGNVWQSDSTELQGNLMPKSKDEVIQRKAEENTWLDPVPASINADKKAKTMTFDQFKNKIQRNVLMFQWFPSYDLGQKSAHSGTGNCFALNNFQIIVPGHCAIHNSPHAVLKIKCADNTLGIVETHIKEMYELPNSAGEGQDFVMIHLTRPIPCRSVKSLLPRENTSGKISAEMYSREHDLSLTTRKLMWDSKVVKTKVAKSWGSEHFTAFDTKNGDCMSPIVSTAKPHVILGFHLASKVSGEKVAFQLLAQDICSKFIVEDDIELQMQFLSDGPHNMEADYPEPHLEGPLQNLEVETEPHFRAVINFVPDTKDPPASVDYFGSAPNLRTRPKSRMQRSPLSEELEEAGLANLHTVPNFQSDRNHADYFQKTIFGARTIPPTLLKAAEDDYIAPLISKESLQLATIIRPLTNDEALNGIFNDRFIKGINIKTAPGLGLRGRKSDHVVLTYDDITGKRHIYLTTYVENEVVLVEECLAEGLPFGPVAKTALKDEPVEIGKNKVRVFLVYPFAFFLTGKKLFAPICSYLYSQSITSELLQGCNVVTDEWEQIRTYVVNKYDKVLEGDFSKFDTTISGEMIRAAGCVCTRIAAHLGYEPKYLRMMVAYINDVATSCTMLNGTGVILDGMVPSGVYVTILINGIVNSLIHRMAFFVLHDSSKLPVFRDHVALGTVGDDSIASTRELRYTMGHISDFCASINMKYTDGTKSKVHKDFQELESASLCKRTWYYEPEIKEWLCPLALPSLHRSVHWLKETDADTIAVNLNNIQAAMMELARHPESVYLMYQRMFRKALSSAGMTHMCPAVEKTRSEHLQYFKKKHFGVWNGLDDDRLSLYEEEEAEEYEFEE